MRHHVFPNDVKWGEGRHMFMYNVEHILCFILIFLRIYNPVKRSHYDISLYLGENF
jgi:hypothetical protein